MQAGGGATSRLTVDDEAGDEAGARRRRKRSRGNWRLRLTGLVAAAAAVLALAAPFGTAAPACTINWDGGGGNNAWGTAANWSTNVLPGTADHVCIPDGATVVHSAGVTTILSLQSSAGLTSGLLTLSGGTLTLTDTTAGNESTATSFTQSGGTLDGAAVLAISSTYTWTTGTQQGVGQTRIAVGAMLTKSGPNVANLNSRTLRVEGTAVVSGSERAHPERGHDRDGPGGDVRPADGRGSRVGTGGGAAGAVLERGHADQERRHDEFDGLARGGQLG